MCRHGMIRGGDGFDCVIGDGISGVGHAQCIENSDALPRQRYHLHDYR
jgi:hypothetical protein